MTRVRAASGFIGRLALSRPVAAPTLAQRILAHLAARPVAPDAALVPEAVTQEGIALAVGAQVAHVSRALKGLLAQGLVQAHLARTPGARRRSRAYTLTDEGLRQAPRALPPAPAAPAPSPAPQSAPARRAPVGRQAELERLLRAADEAAAGRPRVALVEGDSGSGKTRLLEALRDELRARGFLALWGASAPVGEEQLLGPLSPALEGVGFERRYREREAGTPRERALAAAVDALRDAQRRQPVALLLDDLHHAGAQAASFLHGLVLALPRDARVLVVAAFRREEAWSLPNGPLYAALSPLRAMDGAHHVTLGPLPREALAELLRDAGAHHVTPELVARVAEESGGIPLYVLAIAEALADGVEDDDFFPPPVRAGVRERLAGLPEHARLALQAAAVAGHETDYATLQRLHEGPEETLVAALDVLLDRLLLEEVPGAPTLRLRFEHPKLREAVLAETSATRRRWLEARLDVPPATQQR